ncbi:MAG: TAXI family TRAP transporter solute-binding subunit [Candidatus Cloacimonetes bacterium]|nr:TAXI family TRAP transporter solute-binding subunit [Candidatus Cloacimonadota bacterium]
MKFTHIILIIVLLFLIISCAKHDITFVTIGTGGVTGVYYPTGGAISRMVNNNFKEYGIKATVESTAGSVYNINSVLSGDLDFGIAQSDRQYQAIKGLSEWAEIGPQNKLRSVFSIHPEAITLIASDKSGVYTIRDLVGKKVNLGNPGSGQLQNSRDVLNAFNVGEDMLGAEYVKAVEAPGLVQDERMDAFFYTVGHPNGNIKEATSGRIKVHIVPIEGAPIDALLDELPYYDKAIIPHEYYELSTNTQDVPTIGVKATLVTSSDVSDDIVYAFTKEVFENFDEFKTLHPAYGTLTKESMLKGLSAPLHPGALKYYKEAGLIDYIKPSLIQTDM